MDKALSHSYDKNFTPLSDSMSSKPDEEDDYQLNLDNDVENNLNVLSSTFLDMSTPKDCSYDKCYR